MVCEPTSSDVDCNDLTLAARLEHASRVVIAPLREHIGWVDPETERLVYNVRNRLLELYAKKDIVEGAIFKQDIFNLVETTRIAVKVDRVACRLGLIKFPLIGQKEETL